MITNIKDLLEPINSKGQIHTHQDKDPKIGIKHTQCSTFILEKHILAKGEFENKNSNKRNAMLIFFDMIKKEQIGKNILILIYSSPKLRTTNY
jgi:hypothetical protein